MNEKQVLKACEGLGWLNEYMQYTLKTEAPAHFHLLQGLTMYGAALGRKVYFTHGVFRVYPNIFAMLVAPSGRCRKSSAIRISTDLMRKADLDDIKMVGPKATPEAIIQAVYREAPKKVDGKIIRTHPDSVTVVYAPELAVLLNQRDFNRDTVPLLTDLYDCPDKWVNSTITRGEITLYNVFVSAMFATTTKWLTELMPKSAFGGGFMGRIIAAVRENTPRCFPTPPPPSIPLQESCIEGLRHAYQLSGEVIWSEAANREFSDWYIGGKAARESCTDDRESGYQERKPVNLIKTALILACSRGRLTIEPKDLHSALVLLDIFEGDMLELYHSLGDLDTRNADSVNMEKLRAYIKKQQLTTINTVIRYMVHKGVTANKTRELVGTLRDAHMIQMKKNQGQILIKFIPKNLRTDGKEKLQ
jgi:hypothetical protein